MTFLLLALAAAAAPHAVAPRLQTCLDAVRADPAKGAASAADWRRKGGGLEAQQCEGVALAALERWSEAAVLFEQAALEAARTKDLRHADFLVQAGNAWLAGNEPAKARRDFDAALAANLLSPELRGEVHLDRARAAVAAGDTAAARLDIDKALALVPADPMAWYLSAALARRTGDLKRAQTEIARALGLAPEDAPILLEAGNIAGASGEIEAAKGLYARAVRSAPDSEAGRAAKAALAANGG